MDAEQRLYCRFCGERKPGEQLVDLTRNQIAFRDVSVKLLDINADYVSLEDAVLPKTICCICYQTLDKTHSFLSNVKKVQGLLRVIFTDQSNVQCAGTTDLVFTDQSEVKYEGTTDFTSRASTPDSPRMVIDESADEDILAIEESLSKASQNDHLAVTSATEPILFTDDDAPPSTPTVEIAERISKCKPSIRLEETGMSIDLFETKIERWSEYVWLCKYCDESFPNAGSLRTHCLANHNICAGYKCVDCSEKIDDFDVFVEHVRRHHKLLRFSCKYCSIINFGSLDGLSQHKKQHLAAIRCNYCTQTFCYPDDFTTHCNLFNNSIRVDIEQMHNTDSTAAPKSITNREVPIPFNDVTQDIKLGEPEKEGEAIKITEDTPIVLREIKLEYSEDLEIPTPLNAAKKHETTTVVNKFHQLMPERQSNLCTPLPETEPFSSKLNIEREIKDELLQDISDSFENEVTNEVIASPSLPCTIKHKSAGNQIVIVGSVIDLTEDETLRGNNRVIETEAPNASKNNELVKIPSAAESHNSSKSEPQFIMQRLKLEDFLTKQQVTLPSQDMQTIIQSPGGNLTVTVRFLSRDLTPTLVPLLAKAARGPGTHTLQLKELLLKNKQIPNALKVDSMLDYLRKINEVNPTSEIERPLIFHLSEVVGVNETEINAIYRMKQRKVAGNKRKHRKKYKTVVYRSQGSAKPPVKTSVNKRRDTSTDTASTIGNAPIIPSDQSTEDGAKKQSVGKDTSLNRLKEGVSKKLISNPKRKRQFDPDDISVNPYGVKIPRPDLSNGDREASEIPESVRTLVSPVNKSSSSITASTNETQNTRSMPLLETDDAIFKKSCILNPTNELSNSVILHNATLELPSTTSKPQRLSVQIISDAENSLPESSVQLDGVKVVVIEKSSNAPRHSHAEVDLSSQIIRIPVISMTPLNQKRMLHLLPKDLTTAKEIQYLQVPITSIPVHLQAELRERLAAKLTAIATDPRPNPGDQEERLQFRELREILSRESRARVPLPERVTVDKSWTGYRWACCLCSDRVYGTANELREHSKAEHGKCFTMKCVDCDEVEESFAKFAFHVAYHRRFLQQFCPYCNSKVEWSDRDEHAQTHPQKCLACGEIVETKDALKLHVSKYAPTIQDQLEKNTKLNPKQDKKTTLESQLLRNFYQCGKCPVSFRKFRELITHSAVHDDREYVCGICKVTYTEKAVFQRHTQQHRSYSCRICDEDFKTLPQRRQHELNHKEPLVIKCYFCHRTFYKRFYFNKHVQKSHKKLLEAREKKRLTKLKKGGKVQPVLERALSEASSSDAL